MAEITQEQNTKYILDKLRNDKSTTMFIEMFDKVVKDKPYTHANKMQFLLEFLEQGIIKSINETANTAECLQIAFGVMFKYQELFKEMNNYQQTGEHCVK